MQSQLDKLIFSEQVFLYVLGVCFEGTDDISSTREVALCINFIDFPSICFNHNPTNISVSITMRISVSIRQI